MASNNQQQTWVPYETAKDCSLGFCSIYCPQWCYIIFPPPPPFAFVDDGGGDSSSSTAFSPLVIAIIGILATAFLLVSYYTIISKYCGGFRGRRPHRNPISPDDDAADGDQSRRPGTNWQASPSTGLDQASINKISVYRYKRGDGVVDGTGCTVCLCEFREDEGLRLLPKCGHAFHVQCIDAWLSSHSNCPLCRANIVLNQTMAEGERNEEIVVAIHDLEEETSCEENDDGMSKEEIHGVIDNRRDDDDDDDSGGGSLQPIRRPFSMDSSNTGRVSIADILQQSMEDEFVMEKRRGGSSSSRGENSESGRRRRRLHCVMSPVPMKRSVSSGRFGLARQARGRINSVLPL